MLGEIKINEITSSRLTRKLNILRVRGRITNSHGQDTFHLRLCCVKKQHLIMLRTAGERVIIPKKYGKVCNNRNWSVDQLCSRKPFSVSQLAMSDFRKPTLLMAVLNTSWVMCHSSVYLMMSRGFLILTLVPIILKALSIVKKLRCIEIY